MTVFKYLNKKANCYYINNPVRFSPIGTISNEIVEKVFDFSYRMTFGKEGEHRNHRSGGTYKRQNGEIFANTFQGKLAEYALFDVLKRNGIPVAKPDSGVFELGRWDLFDLTTGRETISIKSTKSFGNLLLLEEKDYDEKATYLPNLKGYDFTFLIRMKPFCEDLMKKNRFLYSSVIDRESLRQVVLSERWSYDIPGYVTRNDLIRIINDKYILPRGSMLNGKTRMDASNYYVQSGNMRSLQNFLKCQNKQDV